MIAVSLLGVVNDGWLSLGRDRVGQTWGAR